MRGGFFKHSFLALVLLMSACLFASAAPAANKPAPASGMPDVLVLVLSVMRPYDYISINYSTTLSKADVQKDLQTLAAESGWKLSGVEISTASTGMPGSKPTTQASFKTASIANTLEGTLPLSPFVTALKRYKTMEIDYVMAPGFGFHGLKNFRNKYVNVLMSQSGNAYKYRVVVVDNSFDRIQLPLKPVPKPKPSETGGMPAGARILMICGIAVVGAIVVYVLTTRLYNRPRVG